ncbi:hypothetical protein GIB67_011326 [Kingdonia uniflora]|uniref:Pentatricopeptide repeat-containing protein n=1 Tax=Kingdonia uniflora TaxID=39325 RepID=A0A7J7MNJ2_9MAGN|nr:hypothetical protein GIB67_011326 [Kingdonia uniflora]
MTNSPPSSKNDDKCNIKGLEARVQPNHLNDGVYSGDDVIKYLHSYIFKRHDKTKLCDDDKCNRNGLEARAQPNHLKNGVYSGVEAIKYLHSYIFKGHEKTQLCDEPAIRRKQIHGQAIKRGFKDDLYVQRGLISMYAKCGQCEDAARVFDRCDDIDIVSKNDLIAGYVRIGETMVARLVFDEMKEKNVVSWSIMVDGYSKIGRVEEAKYLFDEMPERNVFSWNSLLFGYLRCGEVDLAREVFDRMPERGVVAWTNLISGYTKNGLFKEALEVFQQMQESGVEPNRVTYISVLPVIAQLGALTQGTLIHAYVDRRGIGVDAVLGAALVDMYCKCGCIDEAIEVFEGIKHKKLSAWNSIISGLAAHGLGREALCLFSRMQRDSSVIPNEITLTGILSACSHTGLVTEGRMFFNLFTEFYKLTPNIKHYGCMVDMLGRAGLLVEAKKLIENMPIEPNLVIWKTLLGACRIHKNAELALHIMRIMEDTGIQEASFYALLFNIFSGAGRWDDMHKVKYSYFFISELQDCWRTRPLMATMCRDFGLMRFYSCATMPGHYESCKVTKMLSMVYRIKGKKISNKLIPVQAHRNPTKQPLVLLSTGTGEVDQLMRTYGIRTEGGRFIKNKMKEDQVDHPQTYPGFPGYPPSGSGGFSGGISFPPGTPFSFSAPPFDPRALCALPGAIGCPPATLTPSLPHDDSQDVGLP